MRENTERKVLQIDYSDARDGSIVATLYGDIWLKVPKGLSTDELSELLYVLDYVRNAVWHEMRDRILDKLNNPQ